MRFFRYSPAVTKGLKTFTVNQFRSRDMKLYFRESNLKNFQVGTCPRTPLEVRASGTNCASLPANGSASGFLILPKTVPMFCRKGYSDSKDIHRNYCVQVGSLDPCVCLRHCTCRPFSSCKTRLRAKSLIYPM